MGGISGLIFIIFTPFIHNDAKYVAAHIMDKGRRLTAIQQVEVGQLFIQVIYLSMAIFALELILYQFLVSAKTRLIKQVNETYLAGEEPWH